MENKIKVHDGIVGAIYLLSIVLGAYVNIQWLYLAGVVAVLQILSMFTGFCPVYYVLNKFMPDTESSATEPSVAEPPTTEPPAPGPRTF